MGIDLVYPEKEKKVMANVMKKGIPLGEVEKALSELQKYGIYILAGEHDAKLFDDAGKMKIESMECTLYFFEKGEESNVR